MSKKPNENDVFFNLFNAEEEPKEASDITENSTEEFVSIVQIEETAPSEPVQTTMFEYENFFTPDVELKEYTLDGEEKAVSEENNFFVEPVKSADDFDESEMVSMLETNPLVDEQEQPEVVIEPINDGADIFDNLLTYKKIKKTTPNKFETPYLFSGKNDDHVRYRLYLPSKRNPKLNRIKRTMLGWTITVLAAIIIALLLRTFVFVIATVDGPSMLPTLNTNEKLFVTKYTYTFSDIERGDIVICRYDKNGYNDVYVKRVIGLGGEEICIEDGVVFINGEALEESYILSPMDNDMPTQVIPYGSVFVMGDNRNVSADSRSVGPIKEDAVIGKVQFRISPFSKLGSVEAKK